MNLMKSILLVVIAIQLIVLVAVLFLTNKVNWELFMKKSSNTVVLETSEVTEKVTFKNILLSDKEEKGLLKSIDDTKKYVYTFMSKESNMEFLYSKDVHQKMTEAVGSYAKNFLGKPYVWGAIGPDKFDCSGFTRKVYGQSGIKIPRYSGHQAEVGTYIEYDKLERGDMVFFDTDRKATGRVNHVGIYLEDGKFIHASSGKKKVVITDFNEKKFYKNRFLWGRRVIQNKIFDTIPSFSLDSLKHFLNKLT